MCVVSFVNSFLVSSAAPWCHAGMDPACFFIFWTGVFDRTSSVLPIYRATVNKTLGERGGGKKSVHSHFYTLRRNFEHSLVRNVECMSVC